MANVKISDLTAANSVSSGDKFEVSTADGTRRVTSDQIAAFVQIGALLASKNLSDLSDKSSSRTNLGLGSASVEDADTFAQIANNLSDLANTATARTNLGLGTAAVLDATDFAQVTNNLSDLGDAQVAVDNLDFLQSGTGATTRSVTAKLRDVFSVRDFGATGDGVTDDTAAFQAAVDAAGEAAAAIYGTTAGTANFSYVTVPPGTYCVTSVEFPLFVAISAEAGSTIKGPRCTVIKHTDVSASAFILGGRCLVRGLFFDCNNTNMVTPTVAPPTISSVTNSGYNEVADCQFQFAYVAIGSPTSVTNNGWFINNISGFVHHRMVYIETSKDISYVTNLHSQNPEGVAWDDTWYSYDNKVLVEINDCDGLNGVNWFSYAGRGLFKHSGTGNLLVALQNVGAENITHGIEIVSGSTTGHQITIDGGYLQTNARADGVYLFSNESSVEVHISNFLFNSAANSDYVRVSSTGATFLNGCTLLGTTGAVGLQKDSATSFFVANNCIFRSLATFFSFDTNCDENVVITPSCRIEQGIGTLYDPTPTGYVDVAEPVLFVTGAGDTQQTTIARRTPSSDHLLYCLGNFTVHEQAANAVGGGGAFVSSASNNGGATSLGAKARFKAYNTNGTGGSEAARAFIQGYTAGDYAPPFVIFETGAFGYQSGEGAGGAVTQLTSKSTGVTLNKTTGTITMNGAELAANTTVSFTLTNSAVAAVDILHIKHGSGGTLGSYRVEATEAAGSATIRVTNITGGALSEAIVLKFYVFKATTS